MQSHSQQVAVAAPSKGRPLKKRFVYMDVLNIVACFAVVVLHCTLTVFSADRGPYWNTALVLQGIFIFAVPVFFMISGANLLNYRQKYSTKTFFKKRFAKVGIGLVAASLVCFLIYRLFPYSFYGAASFDGAGVLDFLYWLATNQINNVYWFLYAILYLYILAPVISLMAGHKKLIEGVLAVSLCTAFLFPMLQHVGLLDPAINTTLFNWPMYTSTATFYFVAGYYLKQWPIEKKSMRLIVFAVGFAALLIMGWLGYSLNKTSPVYDVTYVNENSVFCAFYSVAVFVFFQALEPKLQNASQSAKSVLKKFSGVSFFIYLFHVPVINWFGVNAAGTALPTIFLSYPLLEAVIVYAITCAIGFCWSALKTAVKDAAKARKSA